MRKVIIEVAAITLFSSAVALAAAPSPPAASPSQSADQAWQALAADVNAIAVASDDLRDRHMVDVQRALVGMINDQRETAAKQRKADTDALAAAKKDADTKAQADAKTIADLRKQVEDKTRLLAQGEKMCLPGGVEVRNPSYGNGVNMMHSVPVPNPSPTKR